MRESDRPGIYMANARECWRKGAKLEGDYWKEMSDRVTDELALGTAEREVPEPKEVDEE